MERRILDAQLRNGSWFDTILPTIGAIYALHLSGYGKEAECIQAGLQFLRMQKQEKGRLNRFDLTIWNTSLALSSLLEVKDGKPEIREAVQKGIYFLTQNQGISGGWAFTHSNRELPDHDDTALALIALKKAEAQGYIVAKRTIQKGYGFLLSRQNLDGGWGAFDKNQSVKQPGLLPPYHVEYGHELKDPSTADVTGHALLALSFRNDREAGEAIDRARNWLMQDRAGNCWYGRWGLCYYYGTSRALLGLAAAGEKQTAPYVKQSVSWIEHTQNDDGGWGENYRSYYSKTPVIGKSTLEHTAWCVLSLMKYKYADRKAIDRGIGYLADKILAGGEASYAAAAIEPACYEIYASVFPLQALAEYEKYISGQ